jgi:hypothetical protein
MAPAWKVEDACGCVDKFGKGYLSKVRCNGAIGADAQIVEIETTDGAKLYLVHYFGFNSRSVC